MNEIQEQWDFGLLEKIIVSNESKFDVPVEDYGKRVIKEKTLIKNVAKEQLNLQKRKIDTVLCLLLVNAVKYQVICKIIYCHILVILK